jgi:hypothetical protein
MFCPCLLWLCRREAKLILVGQALVHPPRRGGGKKVSMWSAVTCPMGSA